MNACKTCGRENIAEARFCAGCGGPLSVSGGATIEGGRYDLAEQLGVGGMGEVWRAVDTRLGRDVALKFLNPELLAHPTARARMMREAKALSRMKHVNVVGIHDQFEHGGKVVLALEFVEGGDLEGRLERGALPWRQACEIAVGVLRGLTALHAAGLVHRDLKPGNILMDGETPKITDLGVAHDEAGGGLTRAGARLGTPHYMSPEQIRGTPVDARSDIYALGVMLFEMLVGEVPFTGDTDFDVEKGHVDRVADVGRLPDESGRLLRDILGRALEKAPGDRWENAAAMAHALQEALAATGPHRDRPAPTREASPASAPDPEANVPPQPPRQGRGFSWKHPFALGLVGVVGLLALVTSFGLCEKKDTARVPEERVLLEEQKTTGGGARTSEGAGRAQPGVLGDAQPTNEDVVEAEPGADWYCLCYKEKIDGLATQCTACRASRSQCMNLKKVANGGRKPFVANSVTRACEEFYGQHPGDQLAGRHAWMPSKLAGAWWSDQGCLLP